MALLNSEIVIVCLSMISLSPTLSSPSLTHKLIKNLNLGVTPYDL